MMLPGLSNDHDNLRRLSSAKPSSG